MTPVEIPIDVKRAFDAFSQEVNAQLLNIRAMIFDVAAGNPSIGAIQETLKWGQPSYLTHAPKSGTTIRLGVDKATDNPTIFVHCQTNLLARYRTFYPDTFDFSSNRALIIKSPVEDVEAELRHSIGLALTYHEKNRG